MDRASAGREQLGRAGARVLSLRLPIRCRRHANERSRPWNQACPRTAVIRVSRGNFDPARFAEVERMTRETGKYLIPAIRKLLGLIKYFAAVSPSGSIVRVSVWESDAHAQQM